MRARLLRGFLPLALTVFLSGACATPPELTRVRVTAPSWSSLDLGRPVRLLPTLDLRPSSLSEDAGQTLQSRYSVFMVVNGFGFIHGARIEGVSYLAGDRLELEVDGARRTPVEVAGQLTSQLLGVQPVTRAYGFTPATVDAALALAELPDGLVVLLVRSPPATALTPSPTSTRRGPLALPCTRSRPARRSRLCGDAAPGVSRGSRRPWGSRLGDGGGRAGCRLLLGRAVLSAQGRRDLLAVKT